MTEQESPRAEWRQVNAMEANFTNGAEWLINSQVSARLNALELDVARLTQELTEAQTALSRCGGDNCMGLEVDGVASWVRKERLEIAESALAVSQERVWELEAGVRSIFALCASSAPHRSNLRIALDIAEALLQQPHDEEASK